MVLSDFEKNLSARIPILKIQLNSWIFTYCKMVIYLQILRKVYLDSCEFLRMLIYELSMYGDKADNPAT